MSCAQFYFSAMKGWSALLLLAGIFVQNVIAAENNDAAGGANKFVQVKNWVRASKPVLKKYEEPKPNRTSKASISAFIINGRKAKAKEFPSQVAIVMDSENFCGGSLITEYHVLTAAHCIEPFSKFEVRLGALNREKGEDHIFTEDAIYHEKYDPKELNNDIGILYLPKTVKFTSAVKKTAIATMSQTNRLLQKGMQIIATGWGKDSDRSESIVSILKTSNLRVLNGMDCILTYGRASFNASSKICAIGINGGSTCQGDSGGPISVKENNVMFQVGIISFGSTLGCEARQPEVITKVASYRSWIITNTGIEI
ncbi:brachyurin-like [Neocloeon triangulifer]|uniref:brachyurin-like n=1 Tax=Neocloeon triangulifer TaxID=2078957 RepID=UPI00286FADD6|nr:brachyurin-like [Neocloeon triangulifer]